VLPTALTATVLPLRFNTRFEELVVPDDKSEGDEPRIVLKKAQLDKAIKDKKHKNFAKDFTCTAVFAPTNIQKVGVCAASACVRCSSAVISVTLLLNHFGSFSP
jgi:hypothetical protein